MPIRNRLVVSTLAVLMLVFSGCCCLPAPGFWNPGNSGTFASDGPETTANGARKTQEPGGGETLGKEAVSGVWIGSDGVCLAFDPGLPGVAFSGVLDEVKDVFTASKIYACTAEGSLQTMRMRLYDAAPPRLAPDFSHSAYEINVRGDPGPYRLLEYEATLAYDDNLDTLNNAVRLSDRARFFVRAFEARGEPAPQTDFMPDDLEKDTGLPEENTVVPETKYYARSTLNESERAFYDAVYDAVLHLQGSVDVERFGVDVKTAVKIVRYVFMDAPELFWANGSFSYFDNGSGVVTSLVMDYCYTPEEAQALQGKIDAEAADILKGADGSMSEYEKFMAVYKELAARIQYDDAAAAEIASGAERKNYDDQTVAGGLAKRRAVCAGISRSLQYLLHKVGIPCCYVTGTLSDPEGSTPPGPHAWNMLEIEGQWYYADLTVDMASMEFGEANYLMTDEECMGFHSLTRTTSNGAENENPLLPACASHRFDAASGLHVSLGAFDAAAANQIKNLLYRSLKHGNGRFEVTFTDVAEAKKAVDAISGTGFAAGLPAYEGFAVCYVYAAAAGSGKVTVWPVYRHVAGGDAPSAHGAGKSPSIFCKIPRLLYNDKVLRAIA